MPDSAQEKTVFQYNLEEVRKAFDPKADDWITLFIQSVIYLKYEINYKTAKLKCKEDKSKFDRKKVAPGIVEPHAFIMIASIKLFLEEYDRIHNNLDMYKYVEKHLLAKKSELYFNGLNVKFKLEDAPKLVQTVDALCVRFYQEVLYAITVFLCYRNKVLTVGIDEANNAYVFDISDMSILEMHEYKTFHKLPYHEGFKVNSNAEKIQA